jgi:hypothetical protein
MSNPSKLGALIVHAEGTAGQNFGVDVTTFTTLRLPMTIPIDVSGLRHDKVAPEFTQQYRQGGSAFILAGIGGTFKTKTHWPGHGSTTSGSPTVTGLETFYGNVFGNQTVSLATSTTATGGTASVPTTAAASGTSAGGIVFLGALGDGRANGQAVAVATHSGSNLTLLTAAPAAMSGGDVVFPAWMIYPNETATTSTGVSYRFLAQGPNVQYEMHGVFPTAAVFSGLGPKETLSCEVTWEVAWWRYSTVTFPSTVATEATLPAVNAAGSLYVQDVGTVARATQDYRDFKIEYTLGTIGQEGPGGVNAFQSLVGYLRTTDSIKVSWTANADATTLTPAIPAMGTQTANKHILWTGSTTAGSRVAAYMPNVCATVVATQFNEDGISRFRYEGMAYTGTTTTSDLTLSAIRWGWA